MRTRKNTDGLRDYPCSQWEIISNSKKAAGESFARFVAIACSTIDTTHSVSMFLLHK